MIAEPILSEQALTILGNTLSAIIIALCTYIAWRVQEFRKTRNLKSLRVEDATWRDQRIHDIIASLRDRFDAQRAYVSRFHNGDHYVDDSELLKKTRTHESVREGMAYQAEEFKGILISTVPDEMALVLEDGPSWRLVRDLKSGKFKHLCLMGGAKAIARCAVRANGKIIGFIGVDFDHEDKPPEQELAVICEYAGRIAEIC